MSDEDEMFVSLKLAYEHNMLDVVGNMHKLNHTESPVFSPWDNVGPLLVLVLGSLFVLLTYRLLWGTVAFLASCALYLFAVRPWVAWRLHGRLVGLVLRDLPTFKKLWKIGGFSLVWAGYPPDFCHAPKGDWQRFAEKHAQPLALPGAFESEGGAESEEAGSEEGLGMPHREDRRNG
ncbi:MAG: hypothetical protein EPN26_14945 [Rhodospirillales bacterium]|nr:MAG: hypothetical protein EPN26_14945 [Rhodospirillales bacterium]